MFKKSIKLQPPSFIAILKQGMYEKYGISGIAVPIYFKAPVIGAGHKGKRLGPQISNSSSGYRERDLFMNMLVLYSIRRDSSQSAKNRNYEGVGVRTPIGDRA